jgi:hypothetical protein
MLPMIQPSPIAVARIVLRAYLGLHSAVVCALNWGSALRVQSTRGDNTMC